MRIMIDSNVIVSAVLFPESKLGQLIRNIETKHNLILCSYSLKEIEKVFTIKFRGQWNKMENFINSLNYECVETGSASVYQNVNIRDENDLPILISFLSSGADLLVTGDNDFFTPELEKYNIIRPNEYFNLFMKEIIDE